MTRNPMRTEPDYRTADRWRIAGNLLGGAAAINAAVGVPAWSAVFRPGPMGVLLATGLVVGVTVTGLVGFVACRVIAHRYLRYDRTDLDAVPYQQMRQVAYSMWQARHGADAPCAYEHAARRWIARGQLPGWFTLNTNTNRDADGDQ